MRHPIKDCRSVTNLVLVCAGMTAMAGVLCFRTVDAEEFPFVVRVKGAKAAVRCGPGREFYTCDHIARGATLEVFGSEKDEWYAIKPTDTCYSLVLASSVEATEEEGVGEIVRDKTVSWIGQQDGAARNAQWQVRLDEGELVEILGEQKFSPIAGSPTRRYYRIAPPSGEFRWIRAGDVEVDPKWNVVENDEASETENEIGLAELQVPVSNRKLDPDKQDHDREGTQPAAHFVSPKKGEKTSETVADSRGSKWRTSGGPKKSYDDATLETLHLDLSMMVANDPAEWELAPIRTAAERIAGTTKSSLERAKAKRLLERVREFEEIDRRHKQLEQLAATTKGKEEKGGKQGAEKSDSRELAKSKSPRDLASDLSDSRDGKGKPKLDDIFAKSNSRKSEKRGKSDKADESDSSAPPDPRFDGSGFLAPVFSKQSSSPPYALVDKDGNVLQFVSPSPGLNLHRYLRKQVGILGESQYAPELKGTLLTAERVVELDRHKR